MTKEHRLVLARVVAILAGVIACGGAGAEELAGFDCLIEPQTVVEVSTREEGILQEIMVTRGDMVKDGQAIAHLNRDVEQVTVELSEARAELEAEIQELGETLAFAQRESERVDQLSSAKAISYSEKDKATTDAARARLRLQQAHERKTIAGLELERAKRILENRTVRSPVDGVVTERMMSPGESAENRPIVKIAKIDPLYVEIIVPVDYFRAIQSRNGGRGDAQIPRRQHTNSHGDSRGSRRRCRERYVRRPSAASQPRLRDSRWCPVWNSFSGWPRRYAG